MLTRETFARRFGRKPIFGMVHLRPLPGAPLFGGSLDSVIEAARADVQALAAGGCDGLLFENFGDRPFRKTMVDPETIAAMTRVTTEVRAVAPLPFGVNVLRNDPIAALAVAAATGAAFIRVNVHTGAMVTDQGIIEGNAAETLRRRARIAPDVAIFADHMVKHATPLAPVDEAQSAKDLRLRGLADAIVISGSETGVAPDFVRLAGVRQAIDAPILIGSGLTAENAATLADADGAIVGTALKRDGRVESAVDAQRVERLVRAFKQLVVR
jgi:membrane complex biogenesis BtpA family protein